MKILSEEIYPKSGLIPIGKLAKKTRIKVVTIRYYESLKLLPDPRNRNSPQNRKYSTSYIPRLIFIRKARELGFSLKEIKGMIRLSDKRKKIPRKKLIQKITEKMDSIEDQIKDLKSLKRELRNLVTDVSSP